MERCGNWVDNGRESGYDVDMTVPEQPTTISRRGFLLTIGVAPFAVGAVADALVASATSAQVAPPSIVSVPISISAYPELALFWKVPRTRILRARLTAGTLWVDIDLAYSRKFRVTSYQLHRAVESARFHLARRARVAGAQPAVVRAIATYEPNWAEQAFQINRELYFMMPASSKKDARCQPCGSSRED